MIRHYMILLLVGLWSAAAFAQDSVPTSRQALSELIEKARADWNVPGLSVAVIKDGQVVLSQGFGIRELGKPEPVDADTLFAIASNSKAFTAAAIAMLEEDGKLKWDDPVQAHLPWLQLYDPWVSAEIRVDDLLCHRSGLGTFSGDLLWWGTPYSPEDVLRRAKHLPAKGRFRAHFGYSNLMFLAAGEVIHKASGQTWSEFVKARIMIPVGMTRSITSIKDLDSVGNYATPHKPTPEKVSPLPWYNWDTMAAAGGIISSSNDMAKWLNVQLDVGKIDDQHRLFSAASSHRMWSQQTVISVSETSMSRSPSTHFRAYGLGWELADHKGRKMVSHGGGYDGMYSQVLLVPEEQLGIVVLTNSMTGLSGALANTIRDRFLSVADTTLLADGLERERKNRAAFYQRIADSIVPKAEGTKPSRSLDAYAGTFRCPMYGDATVTVEAEKLVLRLLPNSDLVADLTHLHYDTWVIRWRKDLAWFAEGAIQFVPDSSGNFQELRLDVPNDDLWFDELKLKRVPM